jgi:hypothetical protein
MSEAYRHHRASQEIVIVPIAIPVPYEIGSNKVLREVKPGPYKHAQREAWRPQRDIPPRPGKAARLKNWLDAIARQEEAIREFMKPDAALRQAWLARGGVLA